MLSARPATSVATGTKQEDGFLGKIGYVVLGIVTGILAVMLLNGAFSWVLMSMPAEKAPWYAVRAAGILAYSLLWLSTLWGLLLATRWFRKTGAFLATFHEFLSLLALVFALLHTLTLYFDAYLALTWAQILVPFMATSYRPLALGLGQIAFYLVVAVVLSFYVRKRIGNARWRALHYATFITYGLVLVHAVAAGTDSLWTPMRLFYLLSAASVLFMTYVRILARPTEKPSQR